MAGSNLGGPEPHHLTWHPDGPGVLPLPSGRLIRGRALRRPPLDPPADLTIRLLGRGGDIHWPDFWLPTDRAHAYAVLHEAWTRSATERVELACKGGRGRTGTALACIAILDGIPPAEAVTYVRTHYSPHAVETPWQHRYVQNFTGG
ncbi:hypothetical protein GCM10010435_36570 [Winogradskya consettensis]|uniref:Protein phosphatase n=1 Tax=Winogradskya consettensis TaxID=113560 RepID=A0A919T1Q4_9ACTN|nr:hypothetical protein [Actinoplanes consettensis]GIM81658.1 hypothetical protein Aco04nite_77680 [Actinoplanes consettensis]